MKLYILVILVRLEYTGHRGPSQAGRRCRYLEAKLPLFGRVTAAAASSMVYYSQFNARYVLTSTVMTPVGLGILSLR
jgi:hypothetical protein